MTNTNTPHVNLELARELVMYLVAGLHQPADENMEIMGLLDGGDEYEVFPLPGDSIKAVTDNLNNIIRLASDPVLMPTKGRDRADRQCRAERQRQTLQLFARVAAAMLATPTNTERA